MNRSILFLILFIGLTVGATVLLFDVSIDREDHGEVQLSGVVETVSSPVFLADQQPAGSAAIAEELDDRSELVDLNSEEDSVSIEYVETEGADDVAAVNGEGSPDEAKEGVPEMAAEKADEEKEPVIEVEAPRIEVWEHWPHWNEAFQRRGSDGGILFPIGGYSGRAERDKRDGFTLMGPAYRNIDDVLVQCEEVGLPYIYLLRMEIDFLGRHGDPVRSLDFDEVRESIREMVEAAMDSETIVAWYVTPEELRPWRDLEMEYLSVVTETIRETDPLQRPIWMYEPNHRGRGSLETTFAFQDIAGKGVYTNYASRVEERAWVTWTLGVQDAARRSASPNALNFAVLEMFRQPQPEHEDLVRTWVRHDAYSALLSGVDAIVIFSFGGRRNFEAYQDYYEAYREVARDLNGRLRLGEVFLLGEEVQPPGFEVTKGPDHVTLSGRNTTPREPISVPSLHTAAYRYNNDLYFFVVNSAQEPVTIHLHDGRSWQPIFQGQPEWQGFGRSLEIPALGVVAYKLPNAR